MPRSHSNDKRNDRFVLPAGADGFIQRVRERSVSLIQTGIWSGVDLRRLENWLGLFDEGLDRYFAACLLDALIFRPERQTRALMEQLFDRSLPDLCRLRPPRTRPQEDWVARLQEAGTAEPGVRIVPVIRVDDPPTKSGPLLARLYRRYQGINDRWMIWPWQIPSVLNSGVRTLLFIDDLLGSGSQFVRFCEHFHLEELPEDVYAVYAPLVAHQRGIDRVRERLPHVHVTSAEVLAETAGVFHRDSTCFADGMNTPGTARVHYRLLLRRYALDVASNYREGYGSLALTYVFAHGTPNNCLPVFWHSSKRWTALFER